MCLFDRSPPNILYLRIDMADQPLAPKFALTIAWQKVTWKGSHTIPLIQYLNIRCKAVSRFALTILFKANFIGINIEASTCSSRQGNYRTEPDDFRREKGYFHRHSVLACMESR